MRFNKNKTKYYGFGCAGSKAYEVSPVWNLGIHLFENDGCKVFRICYLRTKKRTYYFQYEWQIKNICQQNDMADFERGAR